MAAGIGLSVVPGLSGGAGPAAMAGWHDAAFTEQQLAAGLACAVEDVRAMLTVLGSGASGLAPADLAPGRKIGLAVSLALHRQAGLSLPAAAALMRGNPRICEAVLATVDFLPIAGGGAEKAGEYDPFMLFAPYASEAAAVPAIDHFIDVMDGRRVSWRRPRQDARRLTSELHRLSQAVRADDTPALQDEYIDLLCRLREPADQVSEWIGSIAQGEFRPAPNRFAEATPTMRQGAEPEHDPARLTDAYATRISVNVSLAARSFKRRMLGLPVTDPYDRTPPHDGNTEGETRPR